MNKEVYIVRGCPGSGKSSLAKKIASLHELENKKCVILETDNYFMVDGEYKFDATKLHQNHQKCFSDFLDALNDRHIDVVIVANTFTRKWEYVNYSDAAKDSGCCPDLPHLYLCKLTGIGFSNAFLASAQIYPLPCPSYKDES